MASYGSLLMRERERRGLAGAEVAEATAIYAHDLAALEFEDLALLPEAADVEDLLRRYAAFLEIDAETIVADFRRATPAPHEPVADPGEDGDRDRRPAGATAIEPEQAAPAPRPAELAGAAPGSSEPVRSRRVARTVVTAAGAAAVLLCSWWVLGDRGEATVDAQPDPLRTTPPPASQAAPGSQPASATDAEQEPAPSKMTAPEAGRLAVTEHGVGTGVVDHRLIGASDRFAAGSRVWFWTRVEGGVAGDHVEHVWLHDGSVADRIVLAIGSANWRTQSSKRIVAEGRWTVEARSSDGFVLARAGFVCEPG